MRALRTVAGLTHAQLAERAGCNPFMLSKLERGLHEPAWPLVLALACALGVTVQEFTVAAGEGTQAEPPPRGPGRPRKRPVSAAGHREEVGTQNPPAEARGGSTDAPVPDRAGAKRKKPKRNQGRRGKK